ncbi:MAG: hypothetical protein PHO30_04135 [Candidatus Omnitrophica bacterium]|nr:hypothetical protein [Candidatus Omnitrophota bacterium]
MSINKPVHWQVLFGAVLLLLSAATYYIHYLVFHDARHIFIYLIGDIAFVFIEVLLVTLILHQLLSLREKKAMRKKMNMAIGVFFSEVGKKLLAVVAVSDLQSKDLFRLLRIDAGWSKHDFFRVRAALAKHNAAMRVTPEMLLDLKDFLLRKRPMLLRLLENPNLLEHEAFTDLLWAVFHLAEELSNRPVLTGLPEKDLEHLAGDIFRVRGHLLVQWLDYLEHLKSDYPFLFSLEMRTNVFDAQASIEVR